MNVILLLIAASLILGGCALGVFLWSLRDGQYDDLDGAANRVLFDHDHPNRSEQAAPRHLAPLTGQGWSRGLPSRSNDPHR